MSKARHAVFRLLNIIQKSDLLTYAMRRRVLIAMGVDCGRRVNVEAGVHFRTGPIMLRAGSYINTGCILDGNGGIELGENAHVASNVVITTVTHSVGDARCRAGPLSILPVRIGTGSWIGTGCIVLPGVTIGEGCLIAAGSVVRSDTDADSLFAGVPAVFVKRYDR